MTRYEYKVVPAPLKGLKARGVRSAEGRFANALEEAMNTMGSDGWEYQRAETLPSVERSGLTGSTTTYRNMLVFRRVRPGDVSVFKPVVLEPVSALEDADTNSNDPEHASAPEPAQVEPVAEEKDERPGGQPGAVNMLRDNGVEELSDVAGMTQALKDRASQIKPS